MNLSLQENSMNFSICALYNLFNFFDKDNEEKALSLKTKIKNMCDAFELKGTLLITPEGINGTIAGIHEKIQDFLLKFKNELQINNFKECKFNEAEFVPFEKMKVLIRKEVCSMRSDVNLNLNLTAEDTESDKWDSLLERDDVQLLDTRNDYEYKLGTFKNAIDPNIVNFRDFKDYLKKAIKNKELDPQKPTAIFCTGGIRCEKAGVYMRNIGFNKLYQLKGGILQYFEDTKNTKQKWIGDCFVFDDRITVNDNLEPGNVRCMNCLEIVDDIEEKRSATKGRVICKKCKGKSSLNLKK
jgi:UPF0176 protein